MVVVKNYQAYVNLSNPEDVIHFNNLNASVASVLLHAPWAFVSGIFRPFIFEAGNIFQACAALENLMLLVVFIVAIPKIWVYRKQITELHIGLVCYVALLSIFLALSAPNFGSLARYKIGFTPFLWFALLAASGILKRF